MVNSDASDYGHQGMRHYSDANLWQFFPNRYEAGLDLMLVKLQNYRIVFITFFCMSVVLRMDLSTTEKVVFNCGLIPGGGRVLYGRERRRRAGATEEGEETRQRAAGNPRRVQTAVALNLSYMYMVQFLTDNPITEDSLEVYVVCDALSTVPPTADHRPQTIPPTRYFG